MLAPCKKRCDKPRQHIKKQRSVKVKAVVYPVVMYGCESWIIKKAEHRRIDVFELWCWRRFLRVPWTARNPTSPSWRKSTLNIYWKDWSWILGDSEGQGSLAWCSPWGRKELYITERVNNMSWWQIKKNSHFEVSSLTTTVNHFLIR